MNSGAPRCPGCGGLSTNPNDAQCRFCGAALQQQQQYGAPPGYGAQPGYGAPQPNYGAPPQTYGVQQGYGAPQPQPFGAQPFGAPPPYGAPQQGYGAPNPYGGPQPGYPMAPVQGFGGNYGWQINRGFFGSSGWSSFFWFRLAIAGIAISLSLVGACISAISH